MNIFYKTRSEQDGVPDPFVEPLKRDALTAALELRKRGLSYTAISETIDFYHGVRYSPGTWGQRCRENGVPACIRPGQFEARP